MFQHQIRIKRVPKRRGKVSEPWFAFGAEFVEVREDAHRAVGTGQLPSEPPARNLWTSPALSAGAACPQLLRT